MKELFTLNKYFKKYKVRFGLGILFVTIANVFAVLPPMVVRTILDEMYGSIDSYNLLADTTLAPAYVKTVMQIVMIFGLLLLAFAVCRGIFMFFMRQTLIVMSRHIEFDQKNEIYAHYQKLNVEFFKSHKTGDLMSRISEDVARVRSYTGPAIMYTINLVVLTTMAVWGMVRVSWELTIYALFFLPILAYAMIKVNKVINKRSGKIQARLGKLTAMAQETFSGIRVIKSYVQEEAVQQDFEKASREYRRSNIALSKIEAMYLPLMGTFIGLSLIITVYVGGKMAINNQITIGNIAEFIIYITMLTFPVTSLGWTSSIIQRAAASQKRINDFLKIEPKIQAVEGGEASVLKGDIQFENVSFTYPHTGIKALDGVDLKIKAGEKVAIIGRTGSGKSTLAQLILRLYDVDNGTVLIDGKPIKKWQLTKLREQIAYVPQEVFLFSDTVEMNIALGLPTLDSPLIKKAAVTAHIDREIELLQQGYQTVVGERGSKLSGGQKQRVSIARALVKPFRLLILDDCISAVDNTTEQHILQNLNSTISNQTAIIVTHRLFKNWNFDQIIILDEGRIIEQGTHAELLENDGYYSEMYKFQTEG